MSPTTTHHLLWGDLANHIQFCIWQQLQLQILPDMMLTDEVVFTQDGITSTRNFHAWAQKNPQHTTQYHFKLMPHVEY